MTPYGRVVSVEFWSYISSCTQAVYPCSARSFPVELVNSVLGELEKGQICASYRYTYQHLRVLADLDTFALHDLDIV